MFEAEGADAHREDVRSELNRQITNLQMGLATASRNAEAVAFLRGQIDGMARTAHLLGLFDREAMNHYLDAAAAADSRPGSSPSPTAG